MTWERVQGCNLLVHGRLIKFFGHSDAVVLVHEGVIDGWKNCTIKDILFLF